MIGVNLLVLRACDPKALADFYAALGLSFRCEKHGDGPSHFAAEIGDSVLEIYPRRPSEPSTAALRLGLNIPSMDRALNRLRDEAGDIVAAPRMTRWGMRAVVKDPEGHCLELIEKPVPATA